MRPTAREMGTIGVEQNSPILTPGVPKRAPSSATARSQAATSWHPAAVATPCTCAMTGCGIVRIAAHQQRAAVEQPAIRRCVTCRRHLAQIVAGRERGPRRGDHHDTGVFVVAHGLQRAGEVGHQLEAHGVAFLGAVERDAGDRPVALDKDVVAHVSILGLTFENTTTAPDPHIAPSATPPSESSANWPPL